VTAQRGIPSSAADADGTGSAIGARCCLPYVWERRISLFLALPIAPLDRLTLTRAADAISRLDTIPDKGHAA
jgi:hypothetical protein